MIKSCELVFGDDKLEDSYNNLEENSFLKKSIKKAFKTIKNNAFYGIQIPKRLIPKEYVKKYKINNLWKYNLPNGWRLLYSLTTPNEIEIIAIILDWQTHKKYERLFKYYAKK